MQIYTVIATWFGCGNIVKAPGTATSFSTILLSPVVIFNNLLGVLLIVLISAVGMLAIPKYLLDHPNVSDPEEVVVDEIVGQLIAFTLPIIFCRYYQYIPQVFDISYILHYIKAFIISFIFF
ncbi:MAG: phosphatidylglycerophosphatase A [Ehrlichia sp.]